MIFKQVDVAQIKTMADGTIRLCVDVLSGTGDDIKAGFDLKSEETSMILCKTSDLPAVITQIGEALLNQNNA